MAIQRKYHWWAILLRVVLMWPFIAVVKAGEISETAGRWLGAKLPKAYTEYDDGRRV